MTEHLVKKWTELKAESSWLMFKIMSEFVEGFDRLPKIGPCVSIFGSARTKPDHEDYFKATELAKKLCNEGYGVITGGGPGVMEAANKGASEVKGKSVGLSILLPFETEANKFIDPDKLFSFNFFFVRKVMFVKYAQAFVLLPGGFGTLDEMFEVLTLIQTKKVEKVPIILMGKEYWGGLIEWIQKVLVQGNYIDEKDVQLFHLTDDIDEVIQVINQYYKTEELKPNF